ncbi:unnamed protein product [Ectocarpus sp. CCAP 1310/34]|nr:unnamed protein product [Ectocarpus sp. CCAP 1310/34]
MSCQTEEIASNTQAGWTGSF